MEGKVGGVDKRELDVDRQKLLHNSLHNHYTIEKNSTLSRYTPDE
jgi:hypothetical protein